MCYGQTRDLVALRKSARGVAGSLATDLLPLLPHHHSFVYVQAVHLMILFTLPF